MGAGAARDGCEEGQPGLKSGGMGRLIGARDSVDGRA